MSSTPKQALATAQQEPPKSLAIFSEGINTSRDFAKGMSCLMSDLIAGRITPQVGNAVVNAGGKLLKVVEMQQRYGIQVGNAKILQLADDTTPATA